ncbi:sensor domain-containing protein [Roseobacter sp. EG26]|uniref:sensor domain-containing protein n=1 Tax=Roseobacter sp. EG26 TaxID=3412477 RepID=UPI003CE5A00D
MQIADFLKDYVSRTQDAIAIAYREADAPEAKLVFINASYTRLFGYEADEVVGGPARIAHDPETWQAYNERVVSKFRAGETQISSELGCVRADGSTFWASIVVFLIEDTGNDGFYTCATFRDISDLKAREAAAAKALEDRDRLLAEQERMYQELLATQTRMFSALNAYPDPFVIYDNDMRLVINNTAYQKSMSTNPNAIKPGMHIRDVLIEAMDCGLMPVPEGGRDAFLEDLLSTARIARDTEDVEMAGDTHHRILRSRAENGDWVLIRMDITELVRQRRSAEELQERLLAAIGAYPAPFCIFDSNSQLVAWNESYASFLTDDAKEIYRGMTLRAALQVGMKNKRYVAAFGREEPWLEEMLASNENANPVEDIELAGDIHHRVMRSRSKNGDLVILRLDTTELVRQRRALQQTQERLISAINAFPDPFAIYDHTLRLLTWNPAFTASLTDDPAEIFVGMTAKEAMQLGVQNGKITVAEGEETEMLEEYVSSKHMKIGIEEVEFGDDEHFRIIVSRSERGELLVLRLNMTESVRQRRTLEQYANKLEAANHEITHKAFHDQLTGLGNRRYLSEKFEELSRRRMSDGGELAALHIDLDRFKQINDTIGHAAGDHVLVDVANRIRSNVRTNDVIARIGGDEFVILLWLPSGSARSEQLAQSLLVDLSRPSMFEGRECRFGASIGIAQTPLADEADLLTNSDVALYKAKRAGRGQIGIFDRTDIEEMRHTKKLADDIMRALEEREFLPFYQPQVDAKTGMVVGIEALARWRHPENGIMTPDKFLSVATDLNVVADIDRMIFEKAINECERSFEDFDQKPSLSFNVSANRIQFEEIKQIGSIASAYSGHVAFELLETIFLEEESDAFLLQLDQLREMGISLEVDDFGSGRASVVALQRIAPDQLKIDQRLVSPIEEGNNAARLVQSIIEIGHALDIGVTAEGVETEDQARILANLGAERLQGYYFSKPLCLDDLLSYLARNRAVLRVV